MESLFTEERKKILFEIDSILRWDKRNLGRAEHALWRLIRWLVVKLTK